MTKIYSRTVPIDVDIVDAFCVLQKGFTDQFVYYDKGDGNARVSAAASADGRAGAEADASTDPVRYMGLGRCIALASLDDVDYEYGAEQEHSLRLLNPAVFFSFGRFDAENPASADELLESFPRLHFMLPEVVLIENAHGRFLQVNSLGPVYAGRVARFANMCEGAPRREHAAIPYELESDSRDAWRNEADEALAEIAQGRVSKVVLSRRLHLQAAQPFSSKDVLVNLIDGDAHGTVIMYRYADVFFCGCTPELLIRKRGDEVESMCLAGTCPIGENDEERARFAANLLSDAKNRAEHDYVVQFVRSVFDRVCYDIEIPDEPRIMSLAHVQHLYTPVRGRVLDGVELATLVSDLHPTPATCGAPVGEAKMLIRRIEPYGRGLYAGVAGVVDGAGDGEFSVSLRTGTFDGIGGWVYAGCGIVDGSDPDAEYEEIDLKLKTILSAFEASSVGEGGAEL